MNSTVKLETSSILHIPINNYEENFTFIINNKEFHTSRLFADLLSPKISSYHIIDPTISQYVINTYSTGDFQTILKLKNFEHIDITNDEIPFINEIFENLEITNKFITINIIDDHEEGNMKENDENDIKSIFNKLEKHHRFSYFYQSQLQKDIDDFSKHLSEVDEEYKEKMLNLGYDIIESIMKNSNVQIESEDEFIDIVNYLYSKDKKYCRLYSYVYFNNVTSEKMKEFVDMIKFEDVTQETWKSLCERLSHDLAQNAEEENEETKRYKKQTRKPFKTILYNNQTLDGIIQSLQNESNIKDEIKVLTSDNYEPWSIFTYKQDVGQNAKDNPWICIEFKNHEIMPTNYTIKSGVDGDNLKTFVLEGSNDNNSNSEWTVLDEENDITFLKESKSIHTFPIRNDKQRTFKYLRVRATGNNWKNLKRVQFCNIEFYGKLFKNA